MKTRTRALHIGLSALLAMPFATGGQAQGLVPQAPAAAPRGTPPRAAAPSAPDPALEAARAAFEALPEDERQSLQDALVWTGDYNGVTTGAFGRRSFEGIQTYQTRTGRPPTGLLTPPERSALLQEADQARRAARFRIQPDPASGVVIGVPEALLSKRSAIPGGSRWQSADGRVTLDSKSFPQGETSLDTLFERATAALPGRKVTYKLKKPDFIVVSAETAGGRFYLRYAEGPRGIRGFSFSYDKALAGSVDRLVIAVANHFSPFPEEAPAPTATGVAVAPRPLPTISVPTASVPAALPSFPTETPVAATGMMLGGGRVVTAAAPLAPCAALRIGTAPARIERRDAEGRLALLRVDGLPARGAPPIRAEAVSPEEALAVLIARPKGAPGVAPARAGVDSVFAPLQPGAGGAPVLDRSGRLVGLVAAFPAAPRLIAGVMPPTSYPVLSAKAVTAFLAESGVGLTAGTGASAATLGQAVAPALGSVAAITCER